MCCVSVLLCCFRIISGCMALTKGLTMMGGRCVCYIMFVCCVNVLFVIRLAIGRV